MYLNRKRVAASHPFLLAGLGLMSLLMARNIPLFAIAAVPILTDWARQSLNRFTAWRKIEDGFLRIDKNL